MSIGVRTAAVTCRLESCFQSGTEHCGNVAINEYHLRLLLVWRVIVIYEGNLQAIAELCMPYKPGIWHKYRASMECTRVVP